MRMILRRVYFRLLKLQCQCSGMHGYIYPNESGVGDEVHRFFIDRELGDFQTGEEDILICEPRPW
jgi:hypothetical protein